MEKVSVIIPSRNELYLDKTVDSLIKNAKEEVEIIVVLDGYEKKPDLPKGVKTIWRKKSKGMRNSVNEGVKKATGKYIMKCDAHCAFDEGYDVKLKKSCKDNWVVVPRRYAIDKNTWGQHKEGIYYDFQYISHPKDPNYTFKGVDWPGYSSRVPKDQQIVDLMTSQGSCWFMHKSFFEKIGGLDEENYGTMGAEAQEVCLKTYQAGGRYVLNRGTWYAHKKKRVGKRGNDRGYKKPGNEWKKSRKYAIDYWVRGEGRPTLDKVLKMFKPVPGWNTKWETVETERFILDRFKLNQGTEKWPRVIKDLNREGLIELWRDLGYKIGAEVGVQYGEFSKAILKGIPGSKMYLVDPYYDYAGSKNHNGRHPEIKDVAHKTLRKYNGIWIQEKSETAFNKIIDKSLDFVYIDGNHDYDFVMLDILLWQRKVRRGGMVCGHDYQTDKNPKTRHVKVAVDNYTSLHQISPVYLTDIKNQKTPADRHASWFWVKS